MNSKSVQHGAARVVEAVLQKDLTPFETRTGNVLACGLLALVTHLWIHPISLRKCETLCDVSYHIQLGLCSTSWNSMPFDTTFGLIEYRGANPGCGALNSRSPRLKWRAVCMKLFT